MNIVTYHKPMEYGKGETLGFACVYVRIRNEHAGSINRNIHSSDWNFSYELCKKLGLNKEESQPVSTLEEAQMFVEGRVKAIDWATGRTQKETTPTIHEHSEATGRKISKWMGVLEDCRVQLLCIEYVRVTSRLYGRYLNVDEESAWERLLFQLDKILDDSTEDQMYAIREALRAVRPND